MIKLMKRAAAAICLAVILLTLGACGGGADKINYLGYQAYPFDAHGVMICDGAEYEVVVSAQASGNVILQIIKPEILCGAVFELKNGSVSITCGEIAVTVNDDGYSASEGILLSAHMFSLSGDNFAGAKVVAENGVQYSIAEYSDPTGWVRVYVQKGLAVPEKLEAELNGHEFSFVFINEK